MRGKVMWSDYLRECAAQTLCDGERPRGRFFGKSASVNFFSTCAFVAYVFTVANILWTTSVGELIDYVPILT